MAQTTFAIIWAYVVQPQWRTEFEQAYGPNGDWVDFFRQGQGHIRTELMRDTTVENRYTTIDYWVTEDAYKAFRDQYADAYQALDDQFEAWTINETLIGSFERVSD